VPKRPPKQDESGRDRSLRGSGHKFAQDELGDLFGFFVADVCRFGCATVAVVRDGNYSSLDTIFTRVPLATSFNLDTLPLVHHASAFLSSLSFM
jgi:hypothetical protein